MTTTATSDAARVPDEPLVHLRALDVMTSEVTTVSPTTTLGEAMGTMRTLGIRHLPVLGDGRFAGIVDDRMLAFALLNAGAGAVEQPVSTAMSHYVPQVAPGEPLQRVAHLLCTSRCDAIAVIDAQEHLLGIITLIDVVTAVASRSGDPSPMPGGDSGPPGADAPMPGVAAAGARS